MTINIAIDGPVASGKSTIAKRLAELLNYVHIDTGAMYRAVAVKAARLHLDWENEPAILHMLETTDFAFTPTGDLIVDGVTVGSDIRTQEAAIGASTVSKHPHVRACLVAIQQAITRSKGFILDGRDIGTVVLPDAELKIFQVADVRERAKRRTAEYVAKGLTVDFDEVLEDLKQRDANDMNRRHSPLMKAEDAVIVDTSHLTIEEAVALILPMVRERIRRTETHD
jgi:cytidylate kinase